MPRNQERQRPPFPRIDRSHPLANGLVFAGLGGGASTLLYADCSPYGNHGTLTSMDPSTDWVWDSTLNRWALDFDGSDDYVNIGKSLFGGATSWTMAGWLRLSSLIFYRSPFFGNVAVDTEPVVRTNDDGGGNSILRVYAYSGGAFYVNAISTTNIVQLNTWIHFAATYDGFDARLFWNGSLHVTGAATDSVTQTAQTVNRIGGGAEAGVSYWPGKIADPLGFKRALSPDEIQRLADPSNVMLSGLILPPRRRLWGIRTTVRYWVGTDSSWNTAANWSFLSGGTGGAGVPTAADDVIFDSGDLTSCTCDVAISCASLTVTSGYSGKLDFADSSYSHTIAGDGTFDGTGEVDCGNATITCSGNVDFEHQTTWTYATSTWVLNGTAKTILTSGKRFKGLTISGTISTAGMCVSFGPTTITGTLTVAAGHSFYNYGTMTCATGTVTGAGTVISNNVSTITGGGTWSVANTETNYQHLLNAGTYGGTWLCRHNSTLGTNTWSLGGNVVFTGAVQFRADKSGGTFTIAPSNYNMTFQGHLTLSQTTGTLAWTKGTGTITLSTTNDQTITTPAAWTTVLEDIVVNKGNTTAKVLLAGNVYTDSFTGTQGRFDLNGNTLDSAGSVTCRGDTGFSFHNGTDSDMDGGVIDIASGTLTLKGAA